MVSTWEASSAQRAFRDAVGRAFGVEPVALVGRSRLARNVRARQAACWLLRQRFPELSWPQIGRLLGGRDHSTVIYGAQQCEARRARHPDFRQQTDALLHGELAERWKPVNPALIAKLVRKSEAEAEGTPIGGRAGRWCRQCDALVGAERVAACESRWCSLRGVVPELAA